MNSKAFLTLEYDKIRTLCASFAASDLGKAETEALVPVSDLETARKLLRQTWEADAIYRRTGRTPVESFPDLRNTLRRAHASSSTIRILLRMVLDIVGLRIGQIE